MAVHIADDGCRIHVDLDGPALGTAGAPCLLIPGLGGEGGFWQGVVAGLGAHHSLIRIDHRGAGHSDRPEDGYSLPRLARDVLGILDDLGLGRAHIVGHSTGGMIAQILATSTPNRVAGLVLSGTWDRVDLRFRRIFEARLALLEAAGPVAYQKLTQALGYDPDWIEAHADLLDAEIAAAPERLRPIAIQAARIRMLMAEDAHHALATITAPTLVIGGTDDALIPFAYSERLVAAIPGARLARMSGGHFYPKSRPAEFASLVAAFLAEVTE